MDTKRMVTGTVVGGIVSFVVGYLVYGILLRDFFAANMGSATGVERETPIFWALGVGNLGMAALLTMVIGLQPGDVSAGQGFKVGATVSFLVALGMDFIQYAVTNLTTLTAAAADPIISLVFGGVVGAVIAMVAGKKG